ncbi:MAG: hypothetical protein MHM6MM_005787, partial [Cercozoa sp. M6MM]
QVDGEAWVNPTGDIIVEHKNVVPLVRGPYKANIGQGTMPFDTSSEPLKDDSVEKDSERAV